MKDVINDENLAICQVAVVRSRRAKTSVIRLFFALLHARAVIKQQSAIDHEQTQIRLGLEQRSINRDDLSTVYRHVSLH